MMIRIQKPCGFIRDIPASQCTEFDYFDIIVICQNRKGCIVEPAYVAFQLCIG